MKLVNRTAILGSMLFFTSLMLFAQRADCLDKANSDYNSCNASATQNLTSAQSSVWSAYYSDRNQAIAELDWCRFQFDLTGIPPTYGMCWSAYTQALSDAAIVREVNLNLASMEWELARSACRIAYDAAVEACPLE